MAIDERDGFFSSALSSKSIASTDVKDFQFSYSLKIVISAWLLYEDGGFNDPCNGKPSRDCHNNWWKMYWNYPCILKYGKCILNCKNPRRERYMIFRQLEYEKLWFMALILRKTAQSGNFSPTRVCMRAWVSALCPCAECADNTSHKITMLYIQDIWLLCINERRPTEKCTRERPRGIFTRSARTRRGLSDVKIVHLR